MVLPVRCMQARDRGAGRAGGALAPPPPDNFQELVFSFPTIFCFMIKYHHLLYQIVNALIH